jgi:hypothetical protein
MPDVQAVPLPTRSLLKGHARQGAYTDCHAVRLEATVTLAGFVAAFYTTPLFRVERLLLGLAGHRSSDAQAAALAAGRSERFAAWTVEARAPEQLLMAAGRTRSWFMTHSEGGATLLHFGSAVIPRRGRAGAPPRMGWEFRALLGFHRLYSRLLLGAAARRLRATPR